MALNIAQQINELINRSNHILITTGAHDTGDGLTSALALKLMFDKINKPADVIVSGNGFEKFNWLPGFNLVKSEIKSLKKLIINLDLSKTKVSEFNYDIKNNTLKIFITPENGEFSHDDVTLESSNFKYDLIIIVNAPDLESLGSLYAAHSDFFYRTSIINVDSSSANEHFGQINLVDINQSSSAEIIFDLFEQLGLNVLDEPTTTCLLTGLVVATNFFRGPAVTPLSLNHAALMIKNGADREKIMISLNRHKNLRTLNLWGRVLARLKTDVHYHLGWSLLSQTDFEKSGTDPDDLAGVVNELIANTPAIETVVFLYESAKGNIAGQIYTSRHYNALDMIRELGGSGDIHHAHFALSTHKLIEAEDLVINQLRGRLKPNN